MTHEAELAREGNALPPLSTADKRALIEAELRKDPNRSAREIARAVGHDVDHKTVTAHRERLGIAAPLGNSPPAGLSKVATAEEAVDNAIAKGMVSLAPDPDVEMYWQIPHQAAIECRSLTNGGVEIWQEGQHGRDEDVIVHVAAGNVVQLARLMLYAAGFKNIGIYTHERDGNVDVEDGHLASNFYEDDDKPGYGPVR